MPKRQTVGQLVAGILSDLGKHNNYNHAFITRVVEAWLASHFIDPDTMKQGAIPRYYGPDHWTAEQKKRFAYLYGAKLLEGQCDNEAEDAEFAAMWPEFAAGRDEHEFP